MKNYKASISKSKWTPKKKAKNDAIELGNSKSEEEVLIKWQDHKIETLVAIYNAMKI